MLILIVAFDGVTINYIDVRFHIRFEYSKIFLIFVGLQ
jgi:hypothetical protein